MKKALVISLLAVFGGYLLKVLFQIDFGHQFFAHGVKDFYLVTSPDKLKVANVVTAIVVNFRGFDTLGEVTVLFLATTAMASILYKGRHQLGERAVLFTGSRIVITGSKLLFAAIFLLGVFVFIHGHLTPGGGFQGGVIVATGFLLMLMAYEDYTVSHVVLSVVESLAGITFASLGLLGLVKGGSFLNDFMGNGTLNALFSGGLIPIIYITVGFKVGAELTGLIYTALNEKD
jgi:multicomponent Na+:H+ antiporter subunit B